MSLVKELIQELKRALEKPSVAEQEIALRIIEEHAEKRFTDIEDDVKRDAVAILDGLILDVMDAPGSRSQYPGCSVQDILIVARGKLITNLGAKVPRHKIVDRSLPASHLTPKRTGHTGKGG